VSIPPSTTSPPRAARRALMMSVAALSAIAAPVALVAATVGGSSPTAAEKPALVSETKDIHPESSSPATRFADGTSTVVAFNASATDAQIARIQGIVAPTTTVPAPAAAPTPVRAPAPTPPTTAPPAPPVTAAPVAVAAPAGADPNDPATWDRLAQCESGGNWATNTGNGYYGGLQFSASTWRSVGGTGLPHQHSRETQIEMGKRLQARAGWGQWPACTRRLGYR
jgi:hypothetical protein